MGGFFLAVLLIFSKGEPANASTFGVGETKAECEQVLATALRAREEDINKALKANPDLTLRPICLYVPDDKSSVNTKL